MHQREPGLAGGVGELAQAVAQSGCRSAVARRYGSIRIDRKMSSLAKRPATSTLPAVAAWMRPIRRRPRRRRSHRSVRRGARPSTPGTARVGASPSRRARPRDPPPERGTASGATSPATRIHSTSLWLRATGAFQSAATFSFASACLTQKLPPATSIREISEDTPPSSGVTVTRAPGGTRPSRSSASRSSSDGGAAMRRFHHESASASLRRNALQASDGRGVCPPPKLACFGIAPPRRTRIAQYLNSGILPNGSSTGLVSLFAAAS